MFNFSKISKERLATCHEDLQVLFNTVIKTYDCSIICGHRLEEDQEKAVREGKSKVHYPNSAHNKTPSLATDVAPYPIDWSDYMRFLHFSGYVLGIADGLYRTGKMKHRLKWGGDWDNDHDFKDQRFNDYPHFQLIIER